AFFLEAFFLEAFFLEAFFLEAFLLDVFLEPEAGVAAGAAVPAAPEEAPASSSMAWFKLSSVLFCIIPTP
ncbi:MAG: hypothetical protein RQ741_12940, partial [Wenzhouxiangellaceae bacterium]|nr:hypothetical protein [Wenzhouxiangellaceae bacterium]